MKQFKQTFILASLSTLFLSGCGSSDSPGGRIDTDHDHDHEISVLVSQTSTTALSLLEDNELEALDDAAAGNGSILVLGETGAFAAIRGNGTVNFVQGLHEEHDEDDEETHEEAHILEYGLSGTDITVVPTSGHFAVLVDGTTTFIEYDELVNETPTTTSTTSLSVNEVYPAIILDDEHDLKLVFDDTNARVFEGTEEILEQSFACSNPTSHAQAHELIIVTCGAGVTALVVEENEAEEHTFSSESLTQDLDGTASNYVWRAQGEVVVGFEPNTSNYVIAELDEGTGQVELVTGSEADAFTFTNNICDMKLDTEASDILAITAGGEFVALNHEGEELASPTLNESSESTCSDFVLASAAKAAMVVDNKAQMAYEIDVDDVENNPNGYHVHGRENLSVDDIASMVIFHEIEAGNHDH